MLGYFAPDEKSCQDFLRGEKFFKNSFCLLHTVLEYDKFTSVNFLPAPCATVRLWTTGGGMDIFWND
ncbi:hypothetical protein HMPREF1992_01806 [Selenomonas sp. oral taxon 892 str. F0426]|nr:hypothetical protein HMPREF1992_01806 [Selenomonas sp. oral taxon 892 str. F0426]